MQTGSDVSTWVRFFKDALIPAQYVNLYANKFCENRIRFDMLSDLDKSLLNEMGITAIGDCLSILKHAKTILSKIEEDKKEQSTSSNTNTNNSDQSTNQYILNSKKRCEVAKRIIESYLGDQELKSEPIATNQKQTNNNLSPELVSRLNFTQPTLSQTNSKQQVIKFNEESLSKVVVSSTTNDDEQNNSKRKLNEVSDTNQNKPLEYRGLLKNEPDLSKKTNIISLNKKSSRTLSLNEALKLNQPVKARLSTPNQKVIKLNKPKEEEEETKSDTLESKESVFKRIKTVNNNNNQTKVTVQNQSDLSSNPNSKIISLKKNTSVQNRLSFK